MKNEPEHTMADRDKTLPESKTCPRILKCFKVFLDSGTCFGFWGRVFGFWDVFWILGCVLDSGKCFGYWDVFLDSGKCFWILGSVFGFWEVFWILGSVFGFREVFLDSGKCFWILGCVLSLDCRQSVNLLAHFFVFCSEKLCVFLYRF